MSKTVAIAGLGAIGLPVARALDAGIPGLSLIAVAARDRVGASDRIANFKSPPAIIPLGALAQADIIVEAASAGALLSRLHLIRRAGEAGARIIVPTGALLGLDAVRAAMEGEVHAVTIETRKPPAGLDGVPYLVEHQVSLAGLTEARKVFDGNAYDAARGFPANVNVAAALALAGVGPERTRVEI